MKLKLFLFSFLFSFVLYGQITIDNTAPYDSPVFLIDNVLLGGGIVASNHSYQGDSIQIGYFDATNTSLGINNGVVMATGDIAILDPLFTGFGGIVSNTVSDPDLLNVANSVPPLLPSPYTNSFTVSSINDVAILEFDFIPTSDSLSFQYVFGSEEYFAFENSQYNDVFGFFLSGPGITGPYSSPVFHPDGSVNLAIVPGSNPPLPITISSVNSVTPINAQYFVDNRGGLDTIAYADGYTTVLTAYAAVQCGETYHIRLAIADGSDSGLSSFVWLQAGSFASPLLEIVDNLGLDSTVLEIPCNSTITLTANGGVGATYEWYDGSSSIFSTNSSVTVSSGMYWVTATSFGCPVVSDTIIVNSQAAPTVDLGIDYTIACNVLVNLDPIVSGGSGLYSYLWNDSLTTSIINVGGGMYHVIVTDSLTSCYGEDYIEITEQPQPNTNITGGGSICEDGSTVQIDFIYDGILPWDLNFYNEFDTISQDNIPTNIYSYTTSQEGIYQILNVIDDNNCISNISGSATVVLNQMPEAVINLEEFILYIGDTLYLELLDNYNSYQWYNQNNELISNNSILAVYEQGEYYVFVIDEHGCTDYSSNTIVNVVPRSEIFVPNSFTPNADKHNELFVIHGQNIKSYSLKIIDRWGNLLFESTTLDKHWDGFYLGKKVTQNKYLYQIDIIGEDNIPFSKSGIINVIY